MVSTVSPQDLGVVLGHFQMACLWPTNGSVILTSYELGWPSKQDRRTSREVSPINIAIAA